MINSNKQRHHGGGNSGIPPYIWGAAGGTAALFGVCYYSFLDEAPITKRKRWIATSPEWERRLGDQEYRQLLSHFRRDILPPTHPASITLNRVGHRIADASLSFAKHNNIESYNAKPYTYTVVRSEMANAFVLPGNHVFVMTGLFRYVKDEDELAVILGHEVAHNLVRHVGEKISGSLVVNLFARLSLLIDPSGVLFTLILPAASVFRELPNSRIQEMEADQIGLLLAADACYDPRAARRVFAAMKSGGETGAAPPEFLSTHPSHDSRISNFDKLIPQAMTTFQADYGERCHEIRQKMSMARKAAAREAAFRDQQQM
jgi:predicted Zn-dependent protease